MFLGTTFFCGKDTFFPPVSNVQNFKSLSVSDGAYDHLFLSSNTDDTIDTIDNEWKFETKLNAPFTENLEGGNVGFSVKNTDTIIIRTREKGEFEWRTILTIPIKDNSDFNFIKSYPYSRNHSQNEYMLISQINGIENSFVITEGITEFKGFFIVDKNTVYGTVYNIEPTDTLQNTHSSKIELKNDKYATIFTNTETNYVSGTTSGCFLKINDLCLGVDHNEGLLLRNNFIKWLSNGRPKVLKLEDGRIYLVKVAGNISDSHDGHEELRRISFDWVEIGDVKDVKTLYKNNLSDVTEQFW